jgi:RHS repeat-associated protein
VLLETNRFVHGPRGVHAQRNNASQWYWHTPDGLGSVRSVLDHTAAVLWATGYTPNGQGYAAAGTDPTLYGFTGEPSDANGLVYLRARHYSPALGQFINRDPAETFNRYAYVGGNPVNRTDPSGLRYDDDFLPRPTLKPVTKPPKAPVTKPIKPQPPAVQPPVVKPPKTNPTPPSNPGSGGGSSKPGGKPIGGGSGKPGGKPIGGGGPGKPGGKPIGGDGSGKPNSKPINGGKPVNFKYPEESNDLCPPGWIELHGYNPPRCDKLVNGQRALLAYTPEEAWYFAANQDELSFDYEYIPLPPIGDILSSIATAADVCTLGALGLALFPAATPVALPAAGICGAVATFAGASASFMYFLEGRTSDAIAEGLGVAAGQFAPRHVRGIVEGLDAISHKITIDTFRYFGYELVAAGALEEMMIRELVEAGQKGHIFLAELAVETSMFLAEVGYNQATE